LDPDLPYNERQQIDRCPSALFTVFDNPGPGADNDTISEVFFDNVVEPSACQFIGADDFPQIPIESGERTDKAANITR
jgi:hypothetical protein